MGLLNYNDENDFEFGSSDYGDSKEDKRFKELKSQLNSIMSSLERIQHDSRPSKRYLTQVSHRTFDKEFKSIRSYLKYRTITSPVHRTPADEGRTLVFYHPQWSHMPVAQIAEQFMGGMTVKDYYLNLGYCRVLRSMTNADTNTNAH